MPWPVNTAVHQGPPVQPFVGRGFSSKSTIFHLPINGWIHIRDPFFSQSSKRSSNKYVVCASVLALPQRWSACLASHISAPTLEPPTSRGLRFRPRPGLALRLSAGARATAAEASAGHY